ncbi:hypothetical protein TNCV_4306111 [Trichonephila clavipes]|nr:hypothetical protein TNCV_4306111 [Trichonephila clavipes]
MVPDCRVIGCPDDMAKYYTATIIEQTHGSHANMTPYHSVSCVALTLYHCKQAKDGLTDAMSVHHYQPIDGQCFWSNGEKSGGNNG